MCQSKATGGQRCAAHTSRKLAQALDARAVANTERTEREAQHGPAYLDNEQWVGEWNAANDAVREARVEHASTTRGAAELRTQADALPLGSGERESIEWALRRGAQMREANAALRREMKARAASRAAHPARAPRTARTASATNKEVMPAHFAADMARIDQIAARPGALLSDGDWRGFNPEVVTPGELSFINKVYAHGYAHGYLAS